MVWPAATLLAGCSTGDSLGSTLDTSWLGALQNSLRFSAYSIVLFVALITAFTFPCAVVYGLTAAVRKGRGSHAQDGKTTFWRYLLQGAALRFACMAAAIAAAGLKGKVQLIDVIFGPLVENPWPGYLFLLYFLIDPVAYTFRRTGRLPRIGLWLNQAFFFTLFFSLIWSSPLLMVILSPIEYFIF